MAVKVGVKKSCHPEILGPARENPWWRVQNHFMLDFFTAHATDLLSLVLCALALLGYQIYLRHRTRRDPGSSAQDIMLVARAAWVETVMQERRDILAVQTLGLVR